MPRNSLKLEASSDANIAIADGNGVILSSAADMRDLILAAHRAGTESVAIDEKSIVAAFFDLRTGLAGEILQTAVNYRVKLIIVGDISRYTKASESFAALVRESNRGANLRFVASLTALGLGVA